MRDPLPPFDVDASQIVNAMPVGVAVADASGWLVFVNAELERMTGYDAGALPGQPVDTLLPALRDDGAAALPDGTAWAEKVRRLSAGGALLARRRDGSAFPVEVALRPLTTGARPMTLATVTDISARRRQDSNFRAIIDAAPYGMVLIDARGRIDMVNQRLCDKFGYASEEMLGRPIEMLLPERYRGGHTALRDSYFRTPTPRSMGGGRDLTGLRKDGTEVPIEIGLSSITTEDGPRVLAAIVNITERRRTELALREANAQLEEFTYVSSHDLRSPIRGISHLVDWIREDLAAGKMDAMLKNLDRMDLRIKRVETLIEDLLTYARAGKRSGRLEPIDLNGVVQELIELEAVPDGMRIRLDIQAPRFVGARTPLATVLRNLLSNAIRHHDKSTGTIAIAAREVGNYCVISVTDDGPGIPPTARERVFRLFQTLTSAERQSSGLGLAITKRLVESHGGSIELDSAEGQTGCTFRVFWPRFMRSDLND
jgi:PAS domain S-box-containing protein